MLDGAGPLPGCVVSVVDPTARPFVQGKVGKPVECGYKVAKDEPDDGFIVDWKTVVGTRSDIRLLPRALDRHRRIFRPVPRQGAMDQGYWDQDAVADLEEGGLFAAIPKRDKASAVRQRSKPSTGFGGRNAGGGRKAHRAGQTAVSTPVEAVSGRIPNRLVGWPRDPDRQPGRDAAVRGPSGGRYGPRAPPLPPGQGAGSPGAPLILLRSVSRDPKSVIQGRAADLTPSVPIT